jgi:hypothetical protein
VSPSEQAIVQELLDAEEANRLQGSTLENQSRLARARRKTSELFLEPADSTP